MNLSELEHPVIEVYKIPIYGCKKPTIWIEYDGGIIKLGTFVNVEAAEMFMDYFEEKGITVAAHSRPQQRRQKEQ